MGAFLATIGLLPVLGVQAGGNAVVNGGFENELRDNLWGSVYGAGPGVAERFRENPHTGTWCYRLRKERKPGGAQLMGSIPIEGVEAFELRFWYRGGGNFGIGYSHLENGREVSTMDTTGKPAGCRIECPPVKEWTLFTRRFTVPTSYRLPRARFRLQFQVWGGDEPREWWLDDLELMPCAPETKSAPPPVGVKVEVVPSGIKYAPVPCVIRSEVETRDGLLLRNGKPFFWVGNGCDLGSAQATPAGMWLAKLQGASVLALESGARLDVREEGTNAIISAKAVPGNVSWQREARRLGFLTETPISTGPLRWSPLKAFSAAHPDFAEHFYDGGHGVAADHGSPLGRSILAATRRCFLDSLVDDADHIVELNREPGPNPRNLRIRRAFRDWAKRKYGTLDEACRTWRREYASWDEVVPIHLDPSQMPTDNQELALKRFAKERYPEFYYDWCAFHIDDNTAGTAAEVEDVRRMTRGNRVTVDVRGHRIYGDSYMAYDPVRMDGLLDLVFIHYGLYSYRYNDTPYHEKTLYDGTCFPLFVYNYFRTNVKHPFIDCEDIVSEARLPGSNEAAMERNDLAGLHATPWKFRIESAGEDGLAAGWNGAGFDDSAWGEIAVPGAWDEMPDYAGRSGVGWYRKTFVPKAREMEYRDGSRHFSLYGRGIAQKGTIWLNGRKVGDVSGWNRKYRFNVGSLLRYGKENTLAIRVDGNGFQNGLRKYIHLLAQDMINEAQPFGRGELESMLWTFMMRGSSGVLVWHWIDGDWLRPYESEVIAPLECAAEVALPDVRNRRSPVAILYGFLNGFGLPCPSDGSVAPEMSWYHAVEMNGVRPDVYAEETFVREVTPERCPLLVVPHVRLVSDATYAHFKRYVESGGLAVITRDSLRKTFTRYRETDIEAFAAAHRNVIIVDENETGLVRLMDFLRPHLPKPEVGVLSSNPREPPLIERMLAGDEGHKVLYLHNWGGMTHELELTVDRRYDGWTLTPLIGAFVRTGTPGGYRVTVEGQRPAAVLLTAPGKAVPQTRPDRLAVARRHVMELNEPRRTPGRPRVLFPRLFEKYAPASKEVFPYVLDRLAALGYETDVLPPSEWTREKLADYRMVVMPNLGDIAWKGDWLSNDAFIGTVADYVRGGGSLMMLAYTARTPNARFGMLGKFARPYGLGGTWNVARDSAHPSFGDPCQITTSALEPHPVTTGVRELLCWTSIPLRLFPDSRLRPVVRVPPTAEEGANQPLAVAGPFGKGKVFCSADALLFQPFRIEHADNATFLVNVLGWLLDEKTDDAARAAFRNGLFLTESDLKE